MWRTVEMKEFEEAYKQVLENDIPLKFYHATYKKLMPSIRKNGLGNTTRVNWEDSIPGVVYLATEPETAYSYAETCEDVPESWLDDIVVLEIDVNDLDRSLLKIDSNVQDNDESTYEYHGIITNFKQIEGDF